MTSRGGAVWLMNGVTRQPARSGLSKPLLFLLPCYQHYGRGTFRARNANSFAAWVILRFIQRQSRGRVRGDKVCVCLTTTAFGCPCRKHPCKGAPPPLTPVKSVRGGVSNGR
jgi:hypothetical protein